MKNLIYLFIVFVISSCYKYEQPTLLSLSGEYRIDKITYENSETGETAILYPGDTFINYSEIDVLDSVQVGFTEVHLDYSVISFNPIIDQFGNKSWSSQSFYTTFGQRNTNDYGYLKFDYSGTTRIYKIIDDGVESLVLRNSGQYSGVTSASKEDITYFLTRVGP